MFAGIQGSEILLLCITILAVMCRILTQKSEFFKNPTDIPMYCLSSCHNIAIFYYYDMFVLLETVKWINTGT